DQSQREVIETVATVAPREANARQAERRQLGEDLRVVVAGPIIGRDVRRELAGAEVTHGVHQLLLVGGQRQLQHASKSLGYLVGLGVGHVTGGGGSFGDAVAWSEAVGSAVGVRQLVALGVVPASIARR